MNKAETLRSILRESLSDVRKAENGVLLSGGIDSLSLAITLRELGKEPICYSFTLNGWVSTDFSLARENANRLGLKFRSILLPTDLSKLMLDVRTLIHTFGVTSKAAIECSWPIYISLQKIIEPDVVSGAAADGYFGLSKKAQIHCKDSLPDFRRAYFAKQNPAQCNSNPKIAKAFGKKLYAPYFTESESILSLLAEDSWQDLNKPKQKMIIREAFPEIAKLVTKPHINLQLGDSKIEKLFRGLLATEFNKKNFKSPIGIYNLISKGEI